MGYSLSAMPPPAEASRRDVLISTAGDLFCQYGIHKVGIDWIIEEAGVAKATLYRHFPCKDDLVVAALQDVSVQGRVALHAALDAASHNPRGRFLALPDAISRAGRHGCVFVLAAQEFPARSHAVHKVSIVHKRAMRDVYAALAKEAGSTLSVADAGSQSQLIIDGVYAAVALGPADAKRAIPAAKQLLTLLLSAD